MENDNVVRKTNPGPLKYNLSALTSPNETGLLCPINYMYDYLPDHARWLKSQPISLSKYFMEPTDNGIRLHTQAAKLPIYTGMEDFRQNKYWRACMKTSEDLLELFAKDRHSSEVVVSNGASMASLVEKQLKTGVAETYARFSIYMYPEADEMRIKLLGQCMVLIFVFDDVWENAEPETIGDLREDLVARLRGSIMNSATDTPLQREMSALRQGLLAGDEEKGNGGAETLETLIDFFYHPIPPREGYSSVREYLNYRGEDIGFLRRLLLSLTFLILSNPSFLWATIKFSIRSAANFRDPKFERFLGLVSDCVAFHNDIASYDKEQQRADTGNALSLINVVGVVMKVERVQAIEAKTMAYAWQLCTENELLQELEELKSRDDMSIGEWRFINACLLMAAGNLFTALVVARYGGEGARIA